MPDFNEQIIRDASEKGIYLKKINFSGRWISFRWGTEKKLNGRYRAFKTKHGCRVQFWHWNNLEDNFHCDYFNENVTEENKKSHEDSLSILLKAQDEIEAKEKEVVCEAVLKSWESFKPAGADHPYLMEKGIKEAFGTRLDHVGNLVIPAFDVDGKIWSYQTVFRKGKKWEKLTFKDSRLRGCFYLIGTLEGAERVYLYEGFADAATGYQNTGFPSACVFGTTNFSVVHDEIRTRYPSVLVVACPDADKAGIQVADFLSKKGVTVSLLPEFRPENRHPSNKDWNDLERVEGREAVKSQLLDLSHRGVTSFNRKQKWLEAFWEDKQIQLKNGVIHYLGEEFAYERLLARVSLEADAVGEKIKKELIRDFVTEWIDSARAAEYREIVDRIGLYYPGDQAKVFIEALCGPVTEEQLAVFKHFIWQVKRKAHGLSVEHHMMPVFIGETGGGKSLAIENLLEPLSPLWMRMQLSHVGDERYHHNFGENLVINLDEMASAERTDVDNLKGAITSPRLKPRILGKNTNVWITNRATLIGTSNRDLDELIKDPTSIRRFYALRTLPREELQKNWETINSINYVDLWRSVDHRERSVIHEYLGDVQKSQEGMRYKTIEEQWIEDSGLQPAEEFSDRCFISNEKLYEHYKAWCEENGSTRWMKSRDSLGRALNRLGFKGHQNRMLGFKTRGYFAVFVNPSRAHLTLVPSKPSSDHYTDT